MTTRPTPEQARAYAEALVAQRLIDNLLQGAKSGLIANREITLTAAAKTIRALQSSLAEKDETIARLQAEVNRCHARLEIDHVFTGGGKPKDGGFLRVEVPMNERMKIPDAIACRDDTIRLQQEYIAELRARCEESAAIECGSCGERKEKCDGC